MAWRRCKPNRYRSSSAPVGGVQRARKWHRDSRPKAALVNSVLPTLFAIGTLAEGHSLSQALNSQEGDTSVHDLTETAIAIGELSMISATPFVAAGFTQRHLHRGQTNRTDTRVPRTFIRTSPR